jgi:hypothetical protein
MNETNEKEPYDLEKGKANIKEEETEIARLEEELKYMDTANCFDETTEVAIGCCQKISLSRESNAMTVQEVIEGKVLIDSILRWCEREIETHGNHNRHWLVRHIQKKVDSIMEAKHVWRI